MHVLYPKDPQRCHVGKEWRFHNEVRRVRSDKYLIVSDPRFRDRLQRRGWKEVPGALLATSEAAELLGVPVPVINRWVESGKLSPVQEGLFLKPEVEKLKAQREAEAE